MSRTFSSSPVVFTIGFFSILCVWNQDALTQDAVQALDARVAQSLDTLQAEIQNSEQGVRTAAWVTEYPHWERNQATGTENDAWVTEHWARSEQTGTEKDAWVAENWVRREQTGTEKGECCPGCCPADCGGQQGCEGCRGNCPATQKIANAECPYAAHEAMFAGNQIVAGNHIVAGNQAVAGNQVIKNQFVDSTSQQMCDDLAETMAECLSDSQIPMDSRRRIIASTMKLLVRNAELEAQAEVARLQLKHEREMALTRENLIQLQARMSAAGEVKTWMGPLYTNLNQTQQSMNNVMTNLQLVNRTLRLLENEKNAAKRRQANQPLPAQLVPQTQPAAQPDRWSQLPNHVQPPRQEERDNHTTQQLNENRDQTFMSRTTSQPAPPRLSDQEVQRQQLESRMRHLQAELDRLDAQNIRTVGWESETKEHPNQLRPMYSHPLRPLRNNR